MINKNSGSEIGVQPEDRKSKADSHWLLPQPQSEIASCILESQKRLCLRAVSSHFIFLSRAGIKGMHHYSQFLWQTSVALGLKVCVTTAWSVRLISVAVLFSDLQASFIY